METIKSVLHNDAQGNSSLPRSRSVTLVYFVLVTAIVISLALSYRNKESASRSLAREAALSRIGGLAQDLRNVGWLSIAGREVTSESEAKMQDAKERLAANISLQRDHTYGGKSVDQLDQTLSYYLQSVDSQWQLIRGGKFEEARRVDFEEISPETESLQEEIRDAILPEGKIAVTATTRSQLEAVTASFLFIAAIIIAALRFHRRQQFIVAERAEQLRVVHVTMRTVQDIVNNCLNQAQLLRLDAEGLVPEESLRLFDQALEDTTAKLQELGNLEVFAEKELVIGSGLDVGASAVEN